MVFWTKTLQDLFVDQSTPGVMEIWVSAVLTGTTTRKNEINGKLREASVLKRVGLLRELFRKAAQMSWSLKLLKRTV